MLEKILNALKSLDHTKDEHWTADGLPRIDVVKQIAGEQAITRDDIVAAAPTFTRANAAAAAPGAAPAAPAATPPVATAPTAPAAPTAPPAPAKAAAPVLRPAKGDPAAIAEATATLKAAQDKLSEIDKYLAEGKKAREDQVRVVEASQSALDAVQPIQTNTDAIQAYLARQRATLAERGEQIAAATKFQREHGFRLADLIPKRAKIDQVMARRSGYGNSRPGSK